MKSSQTTRLAIALGAVLVAAYLLSNYSSSKGLLGEGMESLRTVLVAWRP